MRSWSQTRNDPVGWERLWEKTLKGLKASALGVQMEAVVQSLEADA